jgi:hypothetical protein
MKKVIAVKTTDDYSLILKFNDGKTKCFDVKPYLEYGVFRELKDRDYFKNVSIAFGTVQWKNEQDISPDTLYIEGIELDKKEFGDTEIINANADQLNEEALDTLEYQAEWRPDENLGGKPRD